MSPARIWRVLSVALFLFSASVHPTATAPRASQPAPVAVVVSAGTAPVITARWGDTLSGLAAHYCGRAALYPRLAAASGITNPDRIFAGRTRVALDCAGHRASSVAVWTPATTNTRAQRAVNFALAQLGKPYRWAAAGPYAYDCSGLVMAAYARAGVHLPHQSGAMLSYGMRVTRSQLRPGDVVWPYPGHVVLYLGGGRIVESPRPGLYVHVTALYAFWTARRFT